MKTSTVVRTLSYLVLTVPMAITVTETRQLSTPTGFAKNYQAPQTKISTTCVTKANTVTIHSLMARARQSMIAQKAITCQDLEQRRKTRASFAHLASSAPLLKPSLHLSVMSATFARKVLEPLIHLQNAQMASIVRKSPVLHST